MANGFNYLLQTASKNTFQMYKLIDFEKVRTKPTENSLGRLDICELVVCAAVGAASGSLETRAGT